MRQSHSVQVEHAGDRDSGLHVKHWSQSKSTPNRYVGGTHADKVSTPKYCQQWQSRKVSKVVYIKKGENLRRGEDSERQRNRQTEEGEEKECSEA